MNFRLAVMEDLPRLQAVYEDIIQHMNARQIQIWDELYPCAFFADDIQNQRLYVLYDQTELAAAFALCGASPGAESVKWKDSQGKAVYLDRLGVNVRYLNRGIGGFMLAKAKEAAKALGAEYLRLFVVDINHPAISLYAKHHFTKAEGMYDEIFDDSFVLHEYGYEAVL